MDNDLRNNDSSEMQKYEVLYQKDKEMTDFIQSFEPTRQSELEMIKNLEENIVDLMQKTSRLMEKS